MGDLLTPVELRPMLQAVIDANPDAVNPLTPDGNNCLYTGLGGAHCLIGQLADTQGWDVPGPLVVADADDVARTLRWPVTTSGRRWLTDVQVRADAATAGGRPWSSITLPEVP